jgi:ADP-ribosylation factor-like protein 6
MAFFSKILGMFGLRKKEANILVIGLDNSGKSTILSQFRGNDDKVQEIVPTVGFSVKKFKFKNLNLTAFDMSGQGRYRNLWEHYYSGIDAIIFVIDSGDQLRLIVVKEELDLLLKNDQFKAKPSLPILFFANKMDVDSALTATKISENLALSTVGDRPWFIQVNAASTFI